MFVTIIHNPYSSHVIHNLTALSVEEIVSAVISSVADKKNKITLILKAEMSPDWAMPLTPGKSDQTLASPYKMNTLLSNR